MESQSFLPIIHGKRMLSRLHGCFRKTIVPARITGYATIVLLLASIAAAQTTRRVPSQYKTIQLAINAASHGDTVLVAPGTYKENIDFIGKAILVVSSLGARVTTIEGQAYREPTVQFKNGEGSKSILDGFTVTGGEAAGISCKTSGTPVIDSCIITGNYNYVEYEGGGVSGDATVLNSVVSFNCVARYGGMGGGLASSQAYNTIITRNHATDGGGAIWSSFSHCVIYDNDAEEEGGGIDMSSASNSILWGNTAKRGPQASSSSVSYSCVQGWTPGGGIINKDPRFVNPSAGDFHLRPDSPCIDAGHGIALSGMDFEGDPRMVNGRVDMGPDEYLPPLAYLGEARPGKTMVIRVTGSATTPFLLAASKAVAIPPYSIQGLSGYLHLDPGTLDLLAIDSIGIGGYYDVPIAIPGSTPKVTVPLQALIGTTFSNLLIVTVQ